jgi:hypothetical protein
MSEDIPGYVVEDLLATHPAVDAWVDRLVPVLGEVAPPSVIRLVIDELCWRIGHELRRGRTVDLVVGRLICDGEVVEWQPSE